MQDKNFLESNFEFQNELQPVKRQLYLDHTEYQQHYAHNPSQNFPGHPQNSNPNFRAENKTSSKKDSSRQNYYQGNHSFEQDVSYQA